MNTGNFEVVTVAALVTSSTFGTQRVEGSSEKRIAEIAQAWDPAKVGTISVSRRADGTMFVMDGAHRVGAAKELGIPTLPAIVYNGLTREEEADLFNGLNTFKQPSAVSRFLARVDAGSQNEGVIKRIVEKYGWRIAAQSTDGVIRAVDALERIFRDAAGTLPKDAYPNTLDWVLNVVTTAWGHDVDAVNANLLLGLGQLYGRFGTDVDVKKLTHELSQVRPLVVVGQGRALQDALGGTVPSAIARFMVGRHNSRRRTNLLPEWVWTR